MTKEQALALIEQALNVATTKGVYNMADVKAIVEALEKLRDDVTP